MRFAMSRKVPFAFTTVALPIAALIAGCSSDNSLPKSPASSGSSSGTVEPVGGSSSGGTGSSGGSSSGTAIASGSSSGGGSSSGTGLGGSSSSGTGSGGNSSSGAGSGGSSSGGGSSGGGSSSGGVAKDGGGGSGGGSGGGGDAGKGGASLCAQAKAAPISATICDGFETMPSDFTALPAGSMTADTTQSYRGATSMKFSSSTMAYLTESKTFTGTTKATNNAFWGRYFFLSGIAATAAPMSHSVFGTMVGTEALAADSQGDQFHFVGGSRGKLQTQIRLTTADLYTGGGTTPAAGDPAFPASTDGWQCWEWQLQADDSFQFYINGAPVAEMALTAGKAADGTNLSPLPTVTSLEIGWEYFGTALFAGWIDEVAIGPNRIGCGN
jgi:hypothetical protein